MTSTSRPTLTAKARPSGGIWPRSSAPVGRQGPPADVQRDHEEGDSRGHQAPGRDRHAHGGCPAGPSCAGSAGGLQDQPDSLGQGATRAERRPCAVGRPQTDLRPRARDRGVCRRGVLAHHRPSRGSQSSRVRRAPASQGRRSRSRSATSARRAPSSPTSSARRSRCLRSRRRSGGVTRCRRSSRASCSRRRASRSRRP